MEVPEKSRLGSGLAAPSNPRSNGTSTGSRGELHPGGSPSATPSPTSRLAYRFAPSSPPVLLAIYPEPGPRYELGAEKTVLIGRDPRRSDLLLLHASVSQRHCKIVADDEDCTLYDLGSSNGTFVNGDRLSSSQKLRQGDLITIGRYVFMFLWHISTVASRAEILHYEGLTRLFAQLYPTPANIQTLLLASNLFNLPVDLTHGTIEQVWERVLRQLRKQDVLAALDKILTRSRREHPGSHELKRVQEALHTWKISRQQGNLQERINADVRASARVVRDVLENHLDTVEDSDSIGIILDEVNEEEVPAFVSSRALHGSGSERSAPAPLDLPFELKQEDESPTPFKVPKDPEDEPSSAGIPGFSRSIAAKETISSPTDRHGSPNVVPQTHTPRYSRRAAVEKQAPAAQTAPFPEVVPSSRPGLPNQAQSLSATITRENIDAAISTQAFHDEDSVITSTGTVDEVETTPRPPTAPLRWDDYDLNDHDEDSVITVLPPSEEFEIEMVQDVRKAIEAEQRASNSGLPISMEPTRDPGSLTDPEVEVRILQEASSSPSQKPAAWTPRLKSASPADHVDDDDPWDPETSKTQPFIPRPTAAKLPTPPVEGAPLAGDNRAPWDEEGQPELTILPEDDDDLDGAPLVKARVVETGDDQQDPMAQGTQSGSNSMSLELDSAMPYSPTAKPEGEVSPTMQTVEEPPTKSEATEPIFEFSISEIAQPIDAAELPGIVQESRDPSPENPGQSPGAEPPGPNTTPSMTGEERAAEHSFFQFDDLVEPIDAEMPRSPGTREPSAPEHHPSTLASADLAKDPAATEETSTPAEYSESEVVNVSAVSSPVDGQEERSTEQDSTSNVETAHADDALEEDGLDSITSYSLSRPQQGATADSSEDGISTTAKAIPPAVPTASTPRKSETITESGKPTPRTNQEILESAEPDTSPMASKAPESNTREVNGSITDQGHSKQEIGEEEADQTPIPDAPWDLDPPRKSQAVPIATAVAIGLALLFGVYSLVSQPTVQTLEPISGSSVATRETTQTDSGSPGEIPVFVAPDPSTLAIKKLDPAHPAEQVSEVSSETSSGGVVSTAEIPENEPKPAAPNISDAASTGQKSRSGAASEKGAPATTPSSDTAASRAAPRMPSKSSTEGGSLPPATFVVRPDDIPIAFNWRLLNFFTDQERRKYTQATVPNTEIWDSESKQVVASKLDRCIWVGAQERPFESKGLRDFRLVRCQAGSNVIEGWLNAGAIKE